VRGIRAIAAETSRPVKSAVRAKFQNEGIAVAAANKGEGLHGGLVEVDALFK
jgi:hypothetical protein